MIKFLFSVGLVVVALVAIVGIYLYYSFLPRHSAADYVVTPIEAAPAGIPLTVEMIDVGAAAEQPLVTAYLKNTGRQPITAAALRLKARYSGAPEAVSNASFDLLPAAGAVAPGETYRFRQSLPHADGRLNSVQVEVAALVFPDDTATGDSEGIDRIFAARAAAANTLAALQKKALEFLPPGAGLRELDRFSAEAKALAAPQQVAAAIENARRDIEEHTTIEADALSRLKQYLRTTAETTANHCRRKPVTSAASR